MRFAFYSRNDERSDSVLSNIKKALLGQGLVYDAENPEVVIAVGGDGTFLRAVHHYMPRLEKLFLVGVRSGTLGFFCDYGPDEVKLLARDLSSDTLNLQKYRLLEANLKYDSRRRKVFAVNEIRIESPLKTMMCDVHINGELLETFHGNGVIVASSLGSSAYNKSLGGAMIDPSLPAMQLTGIAPIQNKAFHSLASSVVVGPDCVFDFGGDFSRVVVGFDHAVLETKRTLNAIEIRLGRKSVRILHKQGFGYANLVHDTFLMKE